MKDVDSAGLSPRARAMVGYAEKLTKDPGSMTEEDLQPLKANGLSDEDILNLNLVIAYFNFVNRIAMGLGVEFTEDEMTGYKE